MAVSYHLQDSDGEAPEKKQKTDNDATPTTAAATTAPPVVADATAPTTTTAAPTAAAPMVPLPPISQLLATTTTTTTTTTSSSAPDVYEEHLTCGICQSLLHKCVSLVPCMHSFCACCIGEWGMRSRQCPQCRQNIKVCLSYQHVLLVVGC